MLDKRILYLTVCFFGFGLATTLQIANLSSLLQFAGFKASMIGYLWLIAPLTGLVSQPIMGLLSDNMQTRFGRRRPLLLGSVIMGTIGLIFLPFSTQAYWLVSLIILLDIGCNGNAQLARALILDLTRGAERTQALSWSSALYGVGALCGGILPWMLTQLPYFSPKAGDFGAPFYIKVTFMIGTFLYVASSAITLIMAKEKIGAFQRMKKPVSHKIMSLGKDLTASIKQLPPLFWRLSLILFFAWVAIFSVWNYLNIYVAQTVFMMPVKFTDSLEVSQHYLTQANIISAMYVSVLQLSSTAFAFMIPYLSRRFSMQLIFAWGLLTGGISLIAIALTAHPILIGIFMMFYGVAWAVLTICPYALFAKIIPKKKNGYYMGIINFPIVFPQIITGLCLGFVFQHVFFYHAVDIIFLAGFSIIVSGLLTMRLKVNVRVNGLAWLKGQLKKTKLLSNP